MIGSCQKLRSALHNLGNSMVDEGFVGNPSIEMTFSVQGNNIDYEEVWNPSGSTPKTTRKRYIHSCFDNSSFATEMTSIGLLI